jgi:DNA helicase-2/ATP-dependent DNA helicase PcrA
MGDRHVYGAKSRFLTRAVMACFDQVAFGEPERTDAPGPGTAPVDVAGKLRGMWA